jgi:hypothetical protein
MVGLTATEIDTIAPNWKIACLEELCESSHYGYTSSYGNEGNTRFPRITDITDSGINREKETIHRNSFAALSESFRTLLDHLMTEEARVEEWVI